MLEHVITGLITGPLGRRLPPGSTVRPLARPRWATQRPTHTQARPQLIDAALRRALRRPAGNWYVFGASRSVRPGRPFGFDVAGVELVAWRDTDGTLLVGPGACPHLGAPMGRAVVDQGALICRWHGLRLDGAGCAGWRTLPAYDDGILSWVRLDAVGGGPPTDAPLVPPRPPRSAAVDSVIRVEARCDPEDVLANRLDPWHGVWLHPYSFATLTVRDAPAADLGPDADDRFVVDVTFAVAPGLGAPVEAVFTCPGPRTITMTITAGEGAGSVVETHATPLRRGPDGPRTAIVEAVVATSDRPGFAHVLRAGTALRPLIGVMAKRLWRDDVDYAERRYALRSRGSAG